MAEGYRISESGNFRVTEASVSRTTEGFEVGETGLSATGSLASQANLKTFGTSSLSGAGSKLTAGLGTFAGVVNLTASTTITSEAVVIILAESSLNAIGSIDSIGLRTTLGNSSLTTEGSKASIGIRTAFGTVSQEAFTNNRILENGDARITEASDTRISTLLLTNTIIGSVVANPSFTGFSSEPYYKQTGIWKSFIPYVKHDGTWRSNIKIYKHTNGAWKRSY